MVGSYGRAESHTLLRIAIFEKLTISPSDKIAGMHKYTFHTCMNTTDRRMKVGG